MKRIAQKRIGEDLIQVYQKTKDKIKFNKDVKTKTAVEAYLNGQKERTEKIKNLIDKVCREQVDIIIWGTGSLVMSLFATTALKNCKINGFVDNNRLKQGEEIYGYKIYPPEYLKDKKYTVLICSMLYGEKIRMQLENMNTKNKIVVL